MASLNVFVSSKTSEFAKTRKIIKKELENLGKGINVFIFEEDASPSSKKPDEVYREKVVESDIYVGLFRNEYSEATIKEYDIALANNKERLIYVNDSKKELRNANLCEQIKRFYCENTVKPINDDENISRIIIKDVIDLLIQKFDLAIPSIDIDGLTYIYPNYFEDHTNDNVEEWKKGLFDFTLVSIKLNRQLKRENILNDILSKLNSQNVLILTGEIGSSKTTILYEMACYFHESGYFTFIVDSIAENNLNKITINLERLLNDNKKIFIACDNLLSLRVLPILDIIKRISQHRNHYNIKFLLTARSPDFDNLIKNQINTITYKLIPYEYINSISYLTRNEDNVYEIPRFSIEETKNFLLKFYKDRPSYNGSNIEEIAEKINNEANGNPFLIKCLALDISLTDHIARIVSEYLQDKNELETMMICCLLNLSNITITDNLLNQLGIMKFVFSLKNITLAKMDEKKWQTIHRKWDEGFFDLLFNRDAGYYGYIVYLDKALEKIFSLENEEIAYSTLVIIYEMTEKHLFPIEKTEQIVIPDFISKKKRSDLLYGMGYLYIHLKEESGFTNAVEKLDLSVREYPENAHAYDLKGTVLYHQDKYEDSIAMYKKAIELEPNESTYYINIVRPMMWLNYPLDQTLDYGTKAISLCKNDMTSKSSLMAAYNNMGAIYFSNRIYTKAERYFKLSNTVKRNESGLYNLGLINFKGFRDYNKALNYFCEALKLDPQNSAALEFKINSLKMLHKDAQAEVLFKDLEKLDPELYEKMRNFYSKPDWRGYIHQMGWKRGKFPNKWFTYI